MPITAISASDAVKFGCPYCGYRCAAILQQSGHTSLASCGECQQPYLVVAGRHRRSAIGVGEDGSFGFVIDMRRPRGCPKNGHDADPFSYPAVQQHPRKGTPSHGASDVKLAEGEIFSPRGIGKDWTPGCFVCGGKEGIHDNVAAFVQCKAAGERVVALFKQGAWLDYRPSEPDCVQVKVGACDAHLPNLERLLKSTVAADDIVTAAMIREATSTQSAASLPSRPS